MSNNAKIRTTGGGRGFNVRRHQNTAFKDKDKAQKERDRDVRTALIERFKARVSRQFGCEELMSP